jgi:hypothetical protein
LSRKLERLDRSFQTDAQAKRVRPEAGAASGAFESGVTKLRRVDRSFQTDARAKPVRPEVGAASGAE